MTTYTGRSALILSTSIAATYSAFRLSGRMQSIGTVRTQRLNSGLITSGGTLTSFLDLEISWFGAQIVLLVLASMVILLFSFLATDSRLRHSIKTGRRAVRA